VEGRVWRRGVLVERSGGRIPLLRKRIKARAFW